MSSPVERSRTPVLDPQGSPGPDNEEYYPAEEETGGHEDYEVVAAVVDSDTDTDEGPTRRRRRSGQKGKQVVQGKTEEVLKGDKRGREDEETDQGRSDDAKKTATSDEPPEKKARGDSEFEDDDFEEDTLAEVLNVASEVESHYRSSPASSPAKSQPFVVPQPPTLASSPQRAPQQDHAQPSSAPAQHHYPTSWVHSDPAEERGSIFRGHAVGISSNSDIESQLTALKRNMMFAGVRHDMLFFMYACKFPNGSVVKDDGGEQWGDAKIEDCLNSNGATNLLVCVSRIYGGVNIGPVRFVHITECARAACKLAGVAAGSRAPAAPIARPPPPPDAPLCKCGIPAALNTVSKEGKNKGREFFGCSKFPAPDKCDFFEWRGAKATQSRPQSAAASPSRPPSQQMAASPSTRPPPAAGAAGPSAAGNGGVVLSFSVLCSGHGKPTKRLVSHSTANPNRVFYKCNEPDACKFFQWDT